MSNPRTNWIKDIVKINCESTDEIIDKCIETYNNEIDNWYKNGIAGSKIYFYNVNNNENNENIIEMSTESPVIEDQCIYFLKVSEKAINVKIRSDNTVLTGSISKTSLVPMLEQTLTKIYEPMLQTTEEWNAIGNTKNQVVLSPTTGTTTKDLFLKKERQFAELLQTNIANLGTGIDLPLPNAPYDNIDPSSDFDRVSSSKKICFTVLSFCF